MMYLPDLDFVKNTAINKMLVDILKSDIDYFESAAVFVSDYFKSLEPHYQEFYLKNYWPKQKEVSMDYVMIGPVYIPPKN